MRNFDAIRNLSVMATLLAGALLVNACGDDEETTEGSSTPDATTDVEGSGDAMMPDATDDTTMPDTDDDTTMPDTDDDTTMPDTDEGSGMTFPTDCLSADGEALEVTEAAPEAATDACLSDADLAIINGDVSPTSVAGDCGLNNLGANDAGTCSLFCVAGGTGLSNECSSCYAATVVCSIENCLAPCAADPGSDACGACQVESGCTAAFYECSGLPNETEGSGTEGSGTEGSGTEGSGTEGSGTEGSGTEGSGTEGSGTEG